MGASFNGSVSYTTAGEDTRHILSCNRASSNSNVLERSATDIFKKAGAGSLGSGHRKVGKLLVVSVIRALERNGICSSGIIDTDRGQGCILEINIVSLLIMNPGASEERSLRVSIVTVATGLSRCIGQGGDGHEIVAMKSSADEIR